MGIFARSIHEVGQAVAIAALVTFLSTPLRAEPREISSFGSNQGNLRMFMHVPAGTARDAPMVVLLHGCKQRAQSFARDSGFMALADHHKFVLLLPEQKGLPSFMYDSYVFNWVMTWYDANNQNGCFNWFEPNDVARETGEAQSIRQMMDFAIERHAVDRSKVYIAGFSAGGAMTAAMLASYPERFAGGAIIAGVPFGCADTVGAALRCMDAGVDRTPERWANIVRSASQSEFPPVTIWHGEDDSRVVPYNQHELVEQWRAVHRLAASPVFSERSGPLTRQGYGSGSSIRVESVLIRGLPHAFPISTDGPLPCGRLGDFVAEVGVCAAAEILRFWKLNN